MTTRAVARRHPPLGNTPEEVREFCDPPAFGGIRRGPTARWSAGEPVTSCRVMVTPFFGEFQSHDHKPAHYGRAFGLGQRRDGLW